MQTQSFGRIACCVAALGWAAAACSTSTMDAGNATGGRGSGGSQGTGGSSVAPGTGGSGSGGSQGTGGSSVKPGTGGSGSGGATVGTGGNPGTGGRGTGGSGTGGATTGSGGTNQTGGTVGRDGGPGRDGGLGREGGPGGTTGAGGSTTGAGGTTGGGGTTTGGTGLAGAAVPSDGCGKATTAKSGDNQTISVGGSNRTYNLKLPDNYDMNHPYRLIISYHWLNGTAANVSGGSGTAAAWYGQNTTSTGGGTTVFVAPQGINNGWSNSGGSDVTFSRTLITQLEGQICIDKARIFCEGFSMGGSMSYAMASAAPEIIRAVAVHSGGSMSGTTNGHNKPVAYFMTHGTKDSVCTWPGFGLPQLQDFAKVNGCKTPDPTQSASAFQAALPQPTSNQGVCLEFTGCTAGYPTRSCLFVGDHTPSPDGTNGWVPKETWKFFSQF
jgi:poly(3-hydroxybutyrate) depolymerase